MNILEITTCFYGHLRNYGMPVWVLSPLRRIIRIIANRVLPKYLSREVIYASERRDGLIVSFTSFPARIEDVWKVVECLKRQTILPEKIILWLSKKQFPEHDMIPDSLWSRKDNLFEIRLVDDDIRSHKKYFYVMQEYPKKDFITCDDDIFYDPYMIERLIKTSEKYPGCIIANHTSHIRITDDNELLPYATWRDNEEPFASSDRLQIGVGGVLYPNGTLHEMVLRKDLFMQLAPMADDIWLNAMARLQGTKVVQSGKAFITLEITNNSPSLCSINNGIKNMNDIQTQNIRRYFLENGIKDVYATQLS